MPEKRQLAPEKLEAILNNATDLTENHTTYVTNVRFHASNNEVTLDLYYLAPNPRNPLGEPEAQRTHRIVMPPGLAKNIGQLLVNTMTEWEDAFGVTLPLLPNGDELEVMQDE